MPGNPRRANGHRRDQVRRRVLAEESDCWLCGRPVDKTLPPYLHGSPEVDEVIPVSLGGSPIDRGNCRLSHRLCNVLRGNGTNPTSVQLQPQTGTRRVLLVCGPPGAGKTTLARASGLTVYDLDDPQWNRNERRFKQALQSVARDSAAQAAVIRSASTRSARAKAALSCGATETTMLAVDEATCVERIIARGRNEPPIRWQIAAVTMWWAKYQPDLQEAVRAIVTSRTWTA